MKSVFRFHWHKSVLLGLILHTGQLPSVHAQTSTLPNEIQASQANGSSDKKNGGASGDTVLPPPLQGVPPPALNPPVNPDIQLEGEQVLAEFSEPVIPSNYKLGTTIGTVFDYPIWPTSTFTIPDPSGGKVPVGEIRDATRSFSVSPIVEIAYSPPKADTLNTDSFPGFGFGGSGYYISLTSTLQRLLTNKNGTETLDSKTSFNIVVINAEGTVPLPHNITFGIGPRYTSINQEFSASLINQPNNTTLLSHEDFSGVGGTLSLKCTREGVIAEKLFASVDPKVKVDIEWIALVRGSCLVGTNTRWSSLSMGAATSAATKVSEVATSFVPIGELYFGLHYLRPATVLMRKYRLSETDAHPKVEFFAAFTGQVWGDVAMPSASAPSQRASNGSLYLVGFIVGTGFTL